MGTIACYIHLNPVEWQSLYDFLTQSLAHNARILRKSFSIWHHRATVGSGKLSSFVVNEHSLAAISRTHTDDLLSPKGCRGHQCLSQTQTAIARRHFFLSEYLKSGFAQSCLEPLRQINIVKCPAAQTHAIKTSTLAESNGQLNKRFD